MKILGRISDFNAKYGITTWANLLTVSRFFFIYQSLNAGLKGEWLEAALWAFVAALTDLFDGKVARWQKQESEFGKILDPIADKCFMILMYLIDPRTFYVILGIELIGLYFSISVRYYAKEHIIVDGSKQATAVQMTVVIALFVYNLLSSSSVGWIPIGFISQDNLTFVYGGITFMSISRLLAYKSRLSDIKTAIKERRHFRRTDDAPLSNVIQLKNAVNE